MSERQIVIGLGSNLGSRWGTLRAALDRIGALEGITLEAVGRPRATEALVLPGEPPGPPFLNGVCRVRTALDPEALLDRLQALEAELGRTRDKKWAARTLDLDLLAWDGPPLRTPRLALPHAELGRRPFALAGVADVGRGAPPPVDPGAPFAEAPRLVSSEPATGRARVATASDDADALAWALTFGPPTGRFATLAAATAAEFVHRAGLRDAGAAVIFALEGGVRGATAPTARAPGRWSLTHLGDGRCELHLVE